ncbi:phage tail protein [Oxalobacter formigenes]|uniref:Phage Tail Collar Domain protein n=1 Tax=Oxalobacter formigenes OXCC13 TaxID=556269 RepID=C3X9T8_OXAFO|nr:phage tail protein [Oxalobacter formigenes]ARQ45899.1 Phage Tail Collar Domain protein [Oxalobacter formigenes]ARQ78117.1 hypothetical protein BRW84_05430 [Oxalobacter formigenes OXCC13]EEO29964.1 phage Tail Collar Domain protein [Oxalobacter formigenes OXCC13]MCZ4062193.1 phage tail protein [Oxalobacter formigenes]QDX33338.1 tail fiber protein [Oxalobacter formigenes]
MAINEFKPFAATADANVQDQADYEQSEIIRAGFRTGLARSAEVNKAIRQATSITAAVAEFTAEKSGKDMRDDGNIQTMKANFETALSAVSSLLIAEADGTSDALTASFTPTIGALKNGMLVHVRAADSNKTKTPTFKADEMEAKPVVKGNNLSLTEGDIAGAGHWLEMQYDTALDKWVLQNPAKGIVAQQSSAVPIGTVAYFAMTTPPAGYLKADGAEVGRETYPELFSAIGTTFGEGDGSTTFNLPDLIDRFAQGGNTPGQKFEAGLPNIEGGFYSPQVGSPSGAYSTSGTGFHWAASSYLNSNTLTFNASRSNPIYGASNTVQPPALILLPCIKAFDVATNPGLIDITGLANEVATHKHVTKTYNDGTNWYRKWSDGWVEQGGVLPVIQNADYTLTFPVPFADTSYTLIKCNGAKLNEVTWLSTMTFFNYSVTSAQTYNAGYTSDCRWYGCGQSA